MAHRRRIRIKNDKGAAMVEVAIALPVVVMLMVWIFYLGIYLNAQIAVNSAARAGARQYGITGDAQDTAGKAAEALAQSGLSDDYTVEVSTLGGYVNVIVHYSVESAINGIEELLTLTGHATHRIEEFEQP